MSEPKFRAWVFEDEEMAKVDIIDFFSREVDLSDTTHTIVADFSEVELEEKLDVDSFGNDVFVGDIIEARYNLLGFVWEKIQIVPINSSEEYWVATFSSDEIEVIGNIHEDKELLEGGTK